jgi:hypothetical protein
MPRRGLWQVVSRSKARRCFPRVGGGRGGSGVVYDELLEASRVRELTEVLR